MSFDSGKQTDPLAQLSELLRSQRAALVAVGRGEGLTSEEALECVQDALCTHLSSENVGLSADHLLASLKVTVRNAARNFRRRHRRQKPHDPIEPDNEPVAPLETAEALLTRAEDVVRLRSCVAELCLIQRAVVTLRLLEERSGEDVAKTLGLRRGHVDVLVHRARAALRDCMAEPVVRSVIV